MEQHPVPQNITGFQFKLIGDMTIRQFLYLAGGILTGYVFLQFGVPTLIKWTLAFIAGVSGFSFAFVPIEERPLDRWFSSFLKSVYSPTIFFWKKKATPPAILTSPLPISLSQAPETIKKGEVAAKIEEFLITLPTPASELDQREENFLTQVVSFFGGQKEPVSFPTSISSSVTSQVPPKSLPEEKPKPSETPSPLVSGEKLNQESQELTAKIASLEQELNTKEISQERLLQIQAQLAVLLTEKERLTKELVRLKQMLSGPKEEAVRPTVFSQAPEEARVKIVTPSVSPKVGLPKPPSTPNTPSGIVKTRKGSILPGIIIEVRDQEGTPIRALKTGNLGQFVVSTPLPSGTYTIHFEDPQKIYYFDTVEIVLTGQVVPPLEIFAKTEKDKIREELSKKLFGKDNF